MNVKSKSMQALKEYHRKLKAGEIEKPKSLNPTEKAEQNPNSLRFALNAYCYNCSGFTRSEVTKCTAVNCPLYHLRPWQEK
jgi:hypothetical protein